ncbi:hypothetical protein [Actinomadura sp. NEAU-AAG7]|uniref:hypothetical protein n=1 Tax=Actinomadura sp. NEAU-AAG7 TaxID=2839640 RepID=UPI001BE484AF|nr:hypothetical protein [Actinomadura sp. NEAU-AAG7]MBT2207034.1 hypothetical protein [Actinomadura sp. NEAU-AAG7]
MLIVAVTALVTALVGVGVVALAVLCEDGVSSTRYDARTVRACRSAKQATEEQGAAGNEAAREARKYARRSDVHQLVEIGVRTDDAATGTTLDDVQAMTAAYEINTWCIRNGLAN